MELLTTLAQHAAQALDKASEHEQLAFRAQLDSLTGVYNHGSFLKILQGARRPGLAGRLVIGPDHAGRRPFQALQRHLRPSGGRCGSHFDVRRHASSTSRSRTRSVAGEARNSRSRYPAPRQHNWRTSPFEFGEALASLSISTPEGDRIPCPTISQGLAIFPQEAGNLVELVHLADRRLYMAKRKGRNQIQPASDGPEAVEAQAFVENPTSD